MCNLYNATPHGVRRREKEGWAFRVLELLGRLPKQYNIRPTDTGLVIDQADEISQMRWGFRRRQFPSITNARGDNLGKRGMWHESFAERRCIVPAGSFYEFSGPPKQKQAHAYLHADNDFLWIAGLWEEDPVNGKCFAMLTTPPGPVMEPFHDRQVACMEEEQARAFLRGEIPAERFETPLEFNKLITFPTENPLKKGYVPGPPVPMERGPEQLDLL